MQNGATHASSLAPLDPPLARAMREHLVDHVVALEVKDPRVLEAMRSVPRHLFVHEVDFDRAYGDHPLSIGHAATISQPSLVGIMSEALELSGTERVLEIGTGSGYQAAVLGRLAGHVVSLEVVPELAARAARTLVSLGFANVDVHVADGWAGWPPGAPYDRIVVTAAPDEMPSALLAQLKEGGMLVAPIGSQASDQRLERWRNTGGRLTREDLGAVRFVPMVRAQS